MARCWGGDSGYLLQTDPRDPKAVLENAAQDLFDTSDQETQSSMSKQQFLDFSAFDSLGQKVLASAAAQ